MLGIAGRSLFSYCWGSVEAHVSHIDGSRVEGHFLVLLGVVQRKINFPILLGAGGKVIFSYCGGEVTFPILLGIARKSRFSYCWKLSQGGGISVG
jgi:hypothetical protein